MIGKCFPRHRAAEFRKFLDAIEVNVPRDLDVHLVTDNYATHKTPLIRNWLACRPRWHVHLTPTSSSWLKQVERFFALLTERQIRRGIHRSIDARAPPSTILSPPTMPIQNPSAGPSQPTIFSPRSSASASTMPQSKFDTANFWFGTLDDLRSANYIENLDNSCHFGGRQCKAL